MNKTQSLKQIQTWMQTVLVSRGDLPQKLQKATQASNLTIEDVITSKSGASPYQRLDIYAAGYVLRLVDCLKSDFPGLLAFLGTEMLYPVKI